jgi:hypothetical protein
MGSLLAFAAVALLGLVGGWIARGLDTPHELERVQLWLRERARGIEARDSSGRVDYEANGERLQLLDRAGYLSFAPALLVEYRRRRWRRLVLAVRRWKAVRRG